MLKKLFNLYVLSVCIFLFVILSCKTREVNYISYYQRVNEIDSIYRLANQPKKAVKKYKKLFRLYEPKNGEKLEEFATYVLMADEYNMNFGGKKSLIKLIHLLAPGANHDWHKPYYPLFQKYGLDSLTVENEIVQWKSGLNKVLIDSFSVAMDRDQIPRIENDEEGFILSDKKNFELFKWTFENYGFPSQQVIGIEGKNRDIHISTMLLHLGGRVGEGAEFESFKNKVFEYVKSGDCPPIYYAAMVDRHELFVKKKMPPYGVHTGFVEIIDTVLVNKNRKSIGLPSIEYGNRIAMDFLKKYNN